MPEQTNNDTTKSLPVEVEPSIYDQLDENELSVGNYKIGSKDLQELNLDSDAEEVKFAEDKEGVKSDDGDGKKSDTDGQPEQEAKEVDEDITDKDLDEIKSELSDEEKKPLVGDDNEPKYEVMGEKIPVKDLIAGFMKEKDYRQKTMALADERRLFDQEREVYQKQIHEFQTGVENELNLKKQFDYYLEHEEQTDPEFYNQLQDRFKGFHCLTKNPFFESQLSFLNKERESLRKELDELKLGKERVQFQSELSEVRSWVNNKFGKLGFKWDEQKVINAWADQDGDKSVKDIFKTIYGDQLVSLAESKAKLAKTKAKASTVTTFGQGPGSPKDTPAKDVDSIVKKMSYSQIAEGLLSGQIR